MAVNLEPPRPENLLTIAGVRLGVARAGIKKPNRKDLLLVAIDEGGRVAGVFTRNRFAAAPVAVCRERLESGDAIRVIMEHLPVARIEAALPHCVGDLAADHWASAAEAIMTTDTVPKAVSRQVVIDGRTITVTG